MALPFPFLRRAGPSRRWRDGFGPSGRHRHRPMAVSVSVLAALTVVVLTGLGAAGREPPPVELPWLVIALGFLGAEAAALTIEINGERHRPSLSVLPLLLGTMALSPAALVGARLVGAGAAIVGLRRARGLKLVSTLSIMGAETAAVAAVSSVALADGTIDGGGDVILLLVAVPVAELVRFVAVAVVNAGAGEGFALRLAVGRGLDRPTGLDVAARTDTLTGLPGRARLAQALDVLLARPGRCGVVVVAALDHVEEVNDVFGHDVGDDVLRAVAERLVEETRNVDKVARIGGHQFAIVFSDDGLDGVYDGRLAHLAARVGRPVNVEGATVELGLAIGFARWPADARTGPELIRMAEVARSEANRVHRPLLAYDHTIDTTDPAEHALRTQLRAAIEAGEIEVFLQPQVRAIDHQVVAAEALVHWRHPTIGLVPPARFVPWAERSPLAADLTRSVLTAAIDAAARLRDQGTPLAVAVNLTARDLADRDLPRWVSGALARAGVEPGTLTLEVTESSLITDLDAAVATLSGLRALGCRTAADDYGTGYATLQYLQMLPLHEVKIDRSFVLGAVANAGDEAIVRSTAHLIHDLGMQVVAEGVEDARTGELMRQLGCDLLQGYLFSPALPVEAFLDYAAEAGGRPRSSG